MVIGVSRRQLLTIGEQELQGISSSPRLDAEILLAATCNVERYKLITEGAELLSESQQTHYLTLIARRKNNEPIAYLTGTKEFYSRDFKVTPSVLIPRPESELLVERGIVLLRQIAAGRPDTMLKVLDLGTGSGCIALSIVAELLGIELQVQAVAVDISREALDVAQENARQLGVAPHVQFVQGDWCEPLLRPEFRTIEPYDLIVANPPYVAVHEKVSPETVYEPQSALFSEELGLQDTRLIIEQSVAILQETGALLIEIGAGKRGLLPNFFTNQLQSLPYWGEPKLLGDDSAADRFTVLELRKRSKTVS